MVNERKSLGDKDLGQANTANGRKSLVHKDLGEGTTRD